jgi:hypothetical protein
MIEKWSSSNDYQSMCFTPIFTYGRARDHFRYDLDILPSEIFHDAAAKHL